MKFQVVKTITYDLCAEVDTDEASNTQELLDLIEREGDSWINYEQSNGQDEAIKVFGE